MDRAGDWKATRIQIGLLVHDARSNNDRFAVTVPWYEFIKNAAEWGPDMETVKSARSVWTANFGEGVPGGILCKP